MTKQEAEAKIREVCLHLEGFWRLVPDKSSWQIKVASENDEAFYFLRWPDGNDLQKKGKFEIFGSYPHHKALYLRNLPNIGVSCYKDSRQIAKDIEHRFLPDHRIKLKECFEVIERHNEYQRQNKEGLMVFYDLLGEVPRRDTHTGAVDWDKTELYPYYKLISSIHRDSDGSIEIKLRVMSSERAKALVQWLIEQEAPEPIPICYKGNANEIIAQAVEARFGVKIEPYRWERDSQNAVGQHNNRGYAIVNGQEYEVFETFPGVAGLGIDFETKEERKARIMREIKEEE
jgi:hypothetical protein